MTSLKCLRYLADFVSHDPGKRSLQSAAGPQLAGRTRLIALSESESKEEMARHGIPVPAQKLIRDAAELRVAMSQLAPPLALKVDSPEIQHKTEAGGVKLDIHTGEQALAAYEEILNNVRRLHPEVTPAGVLVQEMAPTGLEFIIGVSNDPQLGPMLLVGLGGVFVEVFKDTALYPVPVNKYEALEMLKELKAYPILKGTRGMQPYDIDALASLMVQVADYAFANRETLKELDLNPVFVYGEGHGVIAVDALLIRYAPEACGSERDE